MPGLSLYREVELYEKAGIPVMDALRAATAAPAAVMGLDRTLGTIEPGKQADLIVLDANPLEAIENVERVRLVMAGGVLHRSADLWRAAGFRPPVIGGLRHPRPCPPAGGDQTARCRGPDVYNIR